MNTGDRIVCHVDMFYAACKNHCSDRIGMIPDRPAERSSTLCPSDYSEYPINSPGMSMTAPGYWIGRASEERLQGNA